ncbi:sulfite exporter TauE/SafE family protein [Streptomyces ipomoeae]|uniref:sulfite exporter TauE/SafE family protein n=1 Tax=Streptomyces ipomoeae TaxID=103232 RepID=UPI0029A93C3D|nr:sulfite exporter TauE/SafE family protein [Streptomyces ipomoeae]MDX2828783.1 sulfite exporter TauE/SafE family protein [Streptomyces ipomoeae]MDX2877533.1 sulfite exporter TauE/SafE family protein [Streptomyces ipomoeae]
MSTLVLALFAGGVIGLSLGALGGGGSVLAVPALIYLLGFTPAAATTASLVIVTLASATALAAHTRAGNVRWAGGTLFAAAGLVPAALGGALSADLPSTVLTGAFALVAGLAAYRMLRPSATRREESTVRRSRVALSGAGLGSVTGVLGVGGGFLAVPALVNVVGLRMRDAVGTSLLVITVNSLAALAARTGAAEGLDWAVVAPFTGAAILGAWDGKRLAGKVSGDTLRRTFAWVLLAVAAFMLIDAMV